MYCGQKGCRVLGVPRGNAAPLLQLQDGILDKMPKAIEIFVILTLHLAVLFGRNHNLHTRLLRQINDCIAVIGLVRYQSIRVYAFNKFASLSAICCGTCCNKHSDRIAMRIHGQMYLGVEPPFVRAMSWLPPRAPTAWGCTFT